MARLDFLHSVVEYCLLGSLSSSSNQELCTAKFTLPPNVVVDEESDSRADEHGIRHDLDQRSV